MVLKREGAAKHEMDPWEVDDLVEDTIAGESRMMDLETREFLKTFRRMSSFPKGPKGVTITRADGTPFLSDSFELKHLIELEKKFQMNEFETMKKEDLHEWMKRHICPFKVEDVHFHKIFNLIDLDLDGKISWKEFVGFFEMELIDKHNLVNSWSLNDLSGGYVKPPDADIPHHGLITSLIYWPSVDQNRKYESSVGRYIATTREGIVDVFDLNFDKLYSRKTQSRMPTGFRTHIVKACIMPDINVLCLCEMGRVLRFYNLYHEKLELVYEIYNYEHSITDIAYKFYEDPHKESILAIGDSRGFVNALAFKTDRGGPFKKEPGRTAKSIRWIYVRVGEPEMRVRSFQKIHKRWVENLFFCDEMNCLISTSNYYPKSLAMLDLQGTTVLAFIHVPQGITCAAVLPQPPDVSMLGITGYDLPKVPQRKYFSRWLVTGGLDTRLRVFDPNDPRKPKHVLSHHVSRIKFVVVQQEQNYPIIVSYSELDKISVWNGYTFQLLQVLTTGLGDLNENEAFTICHNPEFKVLAFASYKLRIFRLGESRISAGLTHKTEISCLLYNTVYHVIITTSLGSSIVRWNPFTGRKELLIPKAHLDSFVYGERWYGITVATFNQEQNLLATGATNGSIKMWDFYRGIALREVYFEGTVSHLIWLRSRFIATNFGKKVRVWDNHLNYDQSCRDLATANQHSISAIAFIQPSFIVLGTLGGELQFCDAGSGLPIKRFLVQIPNKNLHLDVDYYSTIENEESKNFSFDMDQYEKCGGVGKIGIKAIYLLESRVVAADIGNLVVALDTGVLQFWSTHPDGGMVDSFYAPHRNHELITTIISDSNNKYLFTGTALGYLKLWLLTDFALPNGTKPLMAELRLQFCFLVREKALNLAKRVANSERGPLLLNCYRAHALAITGIIYVESCQLVITTGGDKCVRYWTLTGQFLNSLDSTMAWIGIEQFQPIKATEFRIPTDLRRVLSTSTLKVLSRDFRCLESGDEEPEIEDDAYKKRIESRVTKRKPFGTSLTLETLGSYFDTPQMAEPTLANIPDLDDTFTCILKNLPLAKTDKVRWIKPPKIIRSKRKRLEHTILWKDKRRCRECKEEEKERGGLDLPHKQGISLDKGIKLRKREKKESQNKKNKFSWKSHRKRHADSLNEPYSAKLLGKSIENMTDACGELVKAATVNFDEFYFFGQKVPAQKKELKSFISSFMKTMAIQDTPTNRKIIKNAIQVEKRKVLGKKIAELDQEAKNVMFKFDCFSEKEKKEILEKEMQKIEGDEYLEDTCNDPNNLQGIHSLIADCLYDSKFMELSNDELLNILKDLGKPLDANDVSTTSQVGYKKRLEWWMNRTGRQVNTYQTKYLSKDSPIRSFIKKLMTEQDFLDVKKNDEIYDYVTNYVKEILQNEPCPKCGAQNEYENTKKGSKNETEKTNLTDNKKKKETVQKRKPLMAIMKSCLLKANLGEIKEDEIENKLSEFLMSIVSKCTPLCKMCNKKNNDYEKATNRFVKDSRKNAMENLRIINSFKKPKQRKHEKDVDKYTARLYKYQARERERNVMEIEKTFQEMKKINLEKLEEKLTRLENHYVKIRGFSKEDKEKRNHLKEEIETVKAKFSEEAKRTLD